MKTKLLLVVLLLGMMLILPAVNAEAVKVVINDVTPQPVEPGNDLTLRVTYSNVDKDFIRNVSSFIDLRYPFSLKTSTESYENGLELCAYCSRTNTFFIHVDSAAKSGTYPIFIRTRELDSESVRTINVIVQGKPNLVLSSDRVLNATPATLFNLVVNVMNIGTGIAGQIKVASKSSNFVSLGNSIVTVNDINPDNYSTVKFQIAPNNDLNAGVYNLPFEVDYVDETGIAYNTTQSIGVVVVNEGLLNIESIKAASDTGGQPTAGMPMTIIVRLQNIGHGNANSIESDLTCNGNIIKTFLGQLKKDEDSPAVFGMTLAVGGTHTCTLVTSFVDDLGSHTATNQFDVTLINQPFPVATLIILLLIVGIIIYYYRKRKK